MYLGDIDRIVRLLAGTALVLLSLTGAAWGLLGALLIATGVIGFCPLYRLLGMKVDPFGRPRHHT